MKVLLDENKYFTGTYAIIGDFEGSIEIPTIPSEIDTTKQLAYKWENEQWIYDEERYNKLLIEKSKNIDTETSKEDLQSQIDDINAVLAELLGME